MLVVTNFSTNSTRKNKFNLLTSRKKNKLLEEPSPKSQFSTNMMIIQKIKFVDSNFDKLRRDDSMYNYSLKNKFSFNHLSKSVEKLKSRHIREIERKIEDSEGSEKIEKLSPMIENLPLTMNKKQKLPSINSLPKLHKTIKVEPSPVKIKIITNPREYKARSDSKSHQQNSLSPQKKNKYNYFIVRRGNNKDLIKSILLMRDNWKEASSDLTTVYNFKWSCSKKGSEFCLLNNKAQKRLLNHFEFDPEISNKKFMFLNFLEYCEKNSLNVFDYLPFTLVIKMNGSNHKENFKKFGELMKNINNYVAENSNQLSQVFNYADLFKSDIVNYKHFNSRVYIPQTHYNGKNLWLVKPTDLYGGKGIQITDSMDEIEKIMKKFFDGIDKSSKHQEEDSDSESESSDTEQIKHKYRSSTVLVQKYIESPLLYYGRKFDIRIWVLIDHKMNVYLFKEGHLKTTSTEYTTDTKDRFVHITNYSLQKYNDNFQKFEEGNEVSFKDFQNCLDSTYPESKIEIRRDIIPQMVEIIKHSTLAVAGKLNRKNRKFCYVVLGYDFMIDTNFKVWLIEINKNPGLVESSPVIKSLVPRMIDDSFRLTVDTVFNPLSANDKYTSPFPVEGYANDESMFEYLHSLSS